MNTYIVRAGVIHAGFVPQVRFGCNVEAGVFLLGLGYRYEGCVSGSHLFSK